MLVSRLLGGYKLAIILALAEHFSACCMIGLLGFELESLVALSSALIASNKLVSFVC